MSDPKICRPLYEVASVETGFAFKSDDFVNFGLPVVRMSDLKKGAVDLGEVARVRNEAVAGLERFRLQRGDYLFGLSGSLDAYGVFSSDDVAYLNQRVGRLGKVEESEADYRYLIHQLSSSGYYRYAYKEAAGIAQLNISPKQVEHFEVFLPTVCEQRKIAEILDTLDTQIRQTETLIAKLERIKQGLLTDLLTRGIDQNGQLRPTPDQASHLYKDSPLGRIPKEWDVVKVGEEAAISHGYAFPGDEFSTEPVGPALLVPGNFHRDGGLYFIAQNTKYFSGKYPSDTVLKKRDVLVVMTDLSPMTLILGRTVLFEEDFPVLHNQRIGKYVFKSPDTWSKEYFTFAMNTPRIRGKIIAEATGTTVRHTSPTRILSCLIAKPSIDEQRRICSILANLDERTKGEKTSFTKAQLERSGLMDDLLTGRLRVTPLLGKAPQRKS